MVDCTLMNSVSRSLIFGVLLFGAPARSLACTYGGPIPTSQNYREASFVFVGKVVEIRQTPVITGTVVVNGVSVNVGTAASQVRFSVAQSLKGTPGAEVTLARDGSSCDHQFNANESYLVFAVTTGNGALVSQGTSSLPLSEATEALKYIDGVRTNRPQAFLYGLVERKEGGQSGFKWWVERFTVQAEANGVFFATQSLPSGVYELSLPPGEYRIRLLRNGQPGSETQRLVLSAGEAKLNHVKAFPSP